MFICVSSKITANEKVLWLVGALKLVRPNVCRYKLLMLSYLQMFGSFRPPKQKYNRIPRVQLLPSAPTCHNTMLAVRCFFCRHSVSLFITCFECIVKFILDYCCYHQNFCHLRQFCVFHNFRVMSFWVSVHTKKTFTKISKTLVFTFVTR